MDAPRLTPAMRVALADLRLDDLIVIYPGDRAYPLAERVTAIPLSAIGDALRSFSAANTRRND